MLWMKLEQLCMKKTLTCKMHLKQRLYSHHMTECMSLEDHLTIFKEIVSNLENMDLKVKNGDLALILLCALPPSYATFVDTLLYSRDKISLEEVYDALFSKEKIK